MEEPKDFYQFALDQTKVSENFVKHGFSLVDKKFLASFKGFKDEMGIFRPLLQRVSDSKTKSARFIRYLFRNHFDSKATINTIRESFSIR